MLIQTINPAVGVTLAVTQPLALKKFTVDLVKVKTNKNVTILKPSLNVLQTHMCQNA